MDSYIILTAAAFAALPQRLRVLFTGRRYDLLAVTCILSLPAIFPAADRQALLDAGGTEQATAPMHTYLRTRLALWERPTLN